MLTFLRQFWAAIIRHDNLLDRAERGEICGAVYITIK
jgi:hypothetical protein